tara:strand:- start:97 stop:369 length:273 start_codon:yes stop_codon:yes gene_type:complete
MNNEMIVDIAFVFVAIVLISLVIYAFIKQLKKVFIFLVICVTLYFGYLFVNRDSSFLEDVRMYREYIEETWILDWEELLNFFNNKKNDKE